MMFPYGSVCDKTRHCEDTQNSGFRPSSKLKRTLYATTALAGIDAGEHSILQPISTFASTLATALFDHVFP